jgi:hypothetical protein
LELNKTHAPAETLFVKLSNRDLISMMIRWAKKNAVGPASRYARVIPLRRFDFADFFTVELVPALPESVADDQLSFKAHRAIVELEKWLRRVAAGDSDEVSLRFFQKQSRRAKERIRSGTLADLVCDARGRAFFRKKLNLELRGSKMGALRGGWRKPAVMIATVALSRLTIAATVAASRASGASVASIVAIPPIGSVTTAFVAASSPVSASA